MGYLAAYSGSSGAKEEGEEEEEEERHGQTATAAAAAGVPDPPSPDGYCLIAICHLGIINGKAPATKTVQTMAMVPKVGAECLGTYKVEKRGVVIARSLSPSHFRRDRNKRLN